MLTHLLLLLTLSGDPQQTLTLTVPVQAQTGVTTFRLWALNMNRQHPDAFAEIRAIAREIVSGSFISNGRSLTCLYADSPGSNATELKIRALNTANLAIKSLEQRVIEECQADGKFPAGTITGTPQ